MSGVLFYETQWFVVDVYGVNGVVFGADDTRISDLRVARRHCNAI